MADLPEIDIIEENGQIGQTVSTNDGLAGIVLAGPAVAGKIQLSDPRQIFGTEGAKALGLDEAYDTTNTTNVYKEIKDFYAEAGEGAALWVLLFDSTSLMATVLDKANAIATKLFDAADGKIRIAACGRVADGAYAPVYADGIDPDVIAAISKAHELAEEYSSNYQPFRMILDARDYQGVIGDLIDLSGNTDSKVLPQAWTNKSGSKNASIGMTLGRAAKVACQRNLGRVKDGAITTDVCYLTDGVTKIEDLSLTELGQFNAKAFNVVRKWEGKNGYFIADDRTATAKTDDYSSFARGRVMDKAKVVAYLTFVDEILDDLDVDDNGYPDAVVMKDYQAKINNQLTANLKSDVDPKNQNVSGVSSDVPPRQNVLSTGQFAMSLKLRPKFYNKEMIITLGFENPALA